MDEELLLMNEQKNMETTSGKVDEKVIEMTRDFESYINLLDEAVVIFKKIDTSFERIYTVAKMLSNCISCYREVTHERKNNLVWQTSLLSYFKKFP